MRSYNGFPNFGKVVYDGAEFDGNEKKLVSDHVNFSFLENFVKEDGTVLMEGLGRIKEVRYVGEGDLTLHLTWEEFKKAGRKREILYHAKVEYDLC